MIAALFILAAAPVAAVNPVLKAEDAYAAAVIAHDRAALERLLAPDLAYAHATGMDQDKAAYIDRTVAPGGIAGVSFRQRTVHVAGALAYVHGVVVYDMGGPRAARYTSVWRKDGGHWRLALWQNTALKD